MLLNELNLLCLLPGVASREEAVRDYIVSAAKPYADEVRVDRMGNVLAYKQGKSHGTPVMLTAHMDEVGVMAIGFTEYGSVKFDFVGEVDRRAVIGKRVFLGKAGVPGVFGMKPIHLTSREERQSYPKTGSLYIDIGARDKAEAQSLVSRGDVGVFASEFLGFGEGRIKSRAISGRVGCAVLLELMKQPLPVDCTFVFTVQEEVGARGAFGAAFSVKPELALVIGSAAANDLPDVPPKRQGCALGKGAVIPAMDGGTIYDRRLFTFLRDTAEAAQIPWQMPGEPEGKTDAMAVQRSRSGAAVAAIAAPVRYARTPLEVAAESDLEAVLQLAEAFLEAVGKEQKG
ncbi:MAG: M42 family peptidase [Clostridiales bacterium]|nr:M42 family peptidase [Clostridiales bacterium]